MSSFDSNTDDDAIIDIAAPPPSPIESLGDSTLVSSICGSMAPLGFFMGIFFARVAGQFAGCRWVFYIGTILTSLTVVVAYFTFLQYSPNFELVSLVFGHDVLSAEAFHWSQSSHASEAPHAIAISPT
jgi:Na+/melibiose symporter-like transporter